jgi:hypothetical protein
MALKVAIVGLSPASHSLAPWGSDEWEVWGLAWDGYWAGMDRVFEMHDMALLKKHYAGKPYFAKLQEMHQTLYMPESVYENVTRYPLEAVIESVGDYFCSSIAYMLALAIHEKADEIAIYGVDMKANEEYAYQRPNIEYLIGLARGRGIKVTIPDQSPLCKFNSHVDFFVGRYGHVDSNLR